jgi:hypothetical protein
MKHKTIVLKWAQYVQSHDKLIGDIDDETPNFQWAPPQGQS